MDNAISKIQELVSVFGLKIVAGPGQLGEQTIGTFISKLRKALKNNLIKKVYQSHFYREMSIFIITRMTDNLRFDTTYEPDVNGGNQI